MMDRIYREAIEAQIKSDALANGPYTNDAGLAYGFYAASGKVHLIADTGQRHHPKVDYARFWSACQGRSYWSLKTQGFGWADHEDLASLDTCKTCMSRFERITS